MEGGFNPELVTAVVTAAVFIVVFLLLVYAIRRARRARRREIEGAEQERRPVGRKKRAPLRAEEIVGEEGVEEPEKRREEEPEEVRARRGQERPRGETAEEPEEEREERPEGEREERRDDRARRPEPSDEAPPAGPLVGKDRDIPLPEARREPAPEKPEPLPAKPEAEAPPAPPHALPKLPEAPPQTAVPLPQEKPREKPKDEPVPQAKSSALAPGLARTRAGWVARLGQIFSGKKELDPSLVEEIEKVLLTADIGVRTSQKLLDEIRSSLTKKELADSHAVWQYLRQRSADFLRVDAPPVDFARAKPFVLLTIGVNGSGKTTTIGKLASKLKAQGKTVLLAAGDTFRAAATEQLEVWGARVGVPVVRGKEGADPSSVIFEAIKRATVDGIDVVIADTAGRLHTKADLMEELQKVRRVVGKALDGAPHETWLVIDSTSGQNAIAQAQIFTQAMSVTGIVLTKLDGTAKGGVILGITDQIRIPVRYVGVGERVEDLRPFDVDEFVAALFESADGG